MREFPLFEEFHTHRRRHRRDMPGRFERSALLVETEEHNRVAVLVSCQQESPFRIQREIPRSSSLARGMADQTEQTARAVDPVDDDAVVTPIRGIHLSL